MTRLYLAILTLLISANTSATDYFSLDFEDGKQPAVNQPMPIWSLPDMFAKNYGTDNFFEVTDKISHSGRYSLRFDYQARNNVCNNCGVFRSTQSRGHSGVDYFVADDGQDLTQVKSVKKKKKNKNKKRPDTSHKKNGSKNNKKNNKQKLINKDKGPAARPGRLVYNKSNGFSRWQVVSVTDENAKNDKLLLKLLDPGIDGQKPEFNAGDKIAIARQCDVDGHVGNRINRRSDCDGIIIWFAGVTGDAQKPGDSIFRRTYIRGENISSDVHQKLHFLRPDANGPNKQNIIIYADTKETSKPVPLVSGLRRIGGAPIYRPGKNGLPASLVFEPDTWYYLEEEFKAATLNRDGKSYNPDGAYRLWFAKSGEEKTAGKQPVLDVTGLQLPPLKGGRGKHISLWGNVQHNSEISGHWYLDDIKVSDRKIGPAK